MILEKAKLHFENKTYTKISRRIGTGNTEWSSGYVTAYNDDFLILQECDDFMLMGFNIIPVHSIEKFRFNKADKYYHKIMSNENQLSNLGMKHNIILDNWSSIFKSLKKSHLNIIVECEGLDYNKFNIGPITKVTTQNVYIHHFDAEGIFEKKSTLINYENITKVTFDDRYINIFSKYTKLKKAQS